MAARKDRRIQRTQQLLRASLLALVREKGFEALSVREIVDRANVGRTTFYAHFSNKEELLLHGFDELRVLLRQRQREARARPGGRSERLFGFSRELFEHVDGHRGVFRAIQSLLIELVREDVKLALPPSRAKTAQREPLVQFIAGALFGLLTWWLDETPRRSPAEIDGTFRRLALAAVDAAAPGA
jgi:AcrR family transcriptional regulator